MQKFAIVNSSGFYLRLTTDGLKWVDISKDAFKYPSKYAAKKHMQMLEDDNLKIEILEN